MAAAVDEVDPAASALRSVNTVVLRDDGSTLGAYSTDGAGFVDSLRADGVDVERSRLVVLGAGGAARSIVDALGRAGVARDRGRQPRPADARSGGGVARTGGTGRERRTTSPTPTWW